MSTVVVVCGRILWEFDFQFCGSGGSAEFQTRQNPYEWDPLFWCHPLFHVFLYTAGLHAMWHVCRGGNRLAYPHRTGFGPVSDQCRMSDLRSPCHSVISVAQSM